MPSRILLLGLQFGFARILLTMLSANTSKPRNLSVIHVMKT
jgi:hypothetical protein